MLKVIIIDDEPDCVKLLSLQLKLFCPKAEVVAECTDSGEGLKQILELRPDLVFLDIEMPVMNGFQLLEKIEKITFRLVFVTAYDQFALKAFRFSALDYLLKPISGTDLQQAVEKAAEHILPETGQLNLLKKQLAGEPGTPPDKIALPYQNGVTFVDIRSLVYCESENNYTRIHTSDGKKYMVAKTLGDIQLILQDLNFLRVHRQYLVNLDQVKKYVRGDGKYLVMSDDTSIPVARNQREKLIERFRWL